MAFTGSFDGTDLTTGNYRVLYAGTSNAAVAPSRLVIEPYAMLPRAARLSRPPGPLVLPYVLRVDGARADGTLASRVDTLMKVLSREGKKLIGSFQDSRWVTATWMPTAPIEHGPYHAIIRGQFCAEQSYWQAATPSASVQTSAFSSLPLLAFETGTAYGYQLSLTPGGGAPTPVRCLYAITGANSPTRVSLRNRYPVPPETLTASGGAASGNIIYFDPMLELVWTSSMGNVIGYWPFADASGTVTDFSTNSRDLSAAGGITYNQDGPEFGACTFNGTTGVFNNTSASFALVANITAMGWVYFTTAGTLMGAFGKGANLGGFAVYKTASDVFAAGVGSSAATRIATGTTTVVVNRWYHVALVWDDSLDTVTLYLDGELEAQTSGAAFTVGGYSGDMLVGGVRDLTATIRYWTGSITSVAVLNTNLTQSQVRKAMYYGLAGYNGTLSSSEPGIWPQLHGENSASTDPLEFRVTHASASPAGRVALGWRSQYPVTG